jgi:SWIM/SEC-C metal-binding protein
MAKLGSEKRPIIVTVQTQERVAEIAQICEEHDWRFIARIEPFTPEDISDLEQALSIPEPVTVEEEPGRNDPCPCGSGKKYKWCCGARTR